MHSTHSSRNNTPPPRGLQYITPTSQLSQTYSGKGTSGGGNRAHPTLPSLVSSSKPQPDVVSPPLTSSVKQLLHMDDVVPPAPKQTREATKFSESMPVTRSTGFNTTFNTKKESTYNTTFNKTTSSRLVPPGQRGAVSSTPPPLATSLRAYLDKEARYNSFISESPETRLEPYREVFGALGEAFPNYAQIFDEIRTAYDAVVQQQATRIVELNSAARTDELRTRQNNDDVQTLQQHIDALQGDLAAMRKELEERESKTQTLNKDAAAATKQVNLDRNSESEALDIAKRRVAELEKNSRGDLEKILLLISSVRECDVKIKKLEETVREMSEQLEELEDARRMAGEAQMELQKYKERFESFVPAKDFDLMKEHLGAELVTFQNENRRLRRTAAARSTQVDVLNRKLLDLESVKNDLVGNKGDKVLTPRPNWDAIRKAMPTLAEYSKDDRCLPMDKGEDGDDGVVDTAELTTVGGPNTTVLQVEFLLETIEALKRRVAELESENATMTKVASDDKLATSGSTKLKRPNVEKAYDCNTIIPILGAGIHASIPKHLQICGAVERVAMPMELRVKIIFDFFVELQQPVMEAASIEDVNVPVHFYNFLEAEVVTSEDVRKYFSHPAQIAYNLLCDAREPSVASPSLVLLECILLGNLPARIAVDSATLVSHAIADLETLSKEQQKNRLRRPAIAECLLPILELKEKSDILELRNVLGSEMSFDTLSFVDIRNKFMRTLFQQECYANMKLYAKIVVGISKKARPSDEEEEIDGETNRVVTLKDVTDSIIEVEPKTPVVILRELTEDAVTRGKGGALVSEDEKPFLIHLSDVMRVIGTAPILRRSPLSPHEDCVF